VAHLVSPGCVSPRIDKGMVVSVEGMVVSSIEGMVMTKRARG